MIRKNDAFGKIQGDTPRTTQGRGRTSSGMSTVSAREAGVVKDVPAPNSWLQLAASLPNAPKPPVVKSARDSFADKFKIENNKAHISLENFYRLLSNSNDRQRLVAMGVARIEIDNGFDFRANFTFATTLPNNWKDEPSIAGSELYKSSISTHMGGHKRLAILIRNKPCGVLSIDDMSDALSVHGNDNVKTAALQHSIATAQRRITCSEVFENLTTLSAAVQKLPDTPSQKIEVIYDLRTAHIIGKSLGFIHLPDYRAHAKDVYRPHNLRSLREIIHAERMHVTRNDYLQSIFGQASGIAITNALTQEVVAILTRPEDFPLKRKLG